MRAKYIGKNETLGFVKEHIYQVTITKRKYGYVAITEHDETDNKEVNLSCTYASQTSIDQNWQKVED